MFKRTYFILSIMLFLSGGHSVADGIDVNRPKPTISGISSGGFMAVQMATIFSQEFSGVGTVAGGFFYCAQDHLQQKIREGQKNFLGAKNLFIFNQTHLLTLNSEQWFEPAPANPLYQSVSICMHNPLMASLPNLNEMQSNNMIQPLDNFKNLNVYIYQGDNDTVVKSKMADQLVSFYADNGVARQQIMVSKSEGGHNFPTDKENLNLCSEQSIPFVSSCKKDVAREILEQTLQASLEKAVPLTENIYLVDQNLDYKNKLLAENMWVQPAVSLAPYGYLYATQNCLQNPISCRLHVALHGCSMSDSFNAEFDNKYSTQISRYQNINMRKKSELLFDFFQLPYIEQKKNQNGTLKFVLNSGYIDYAEKNNLMILFPQTWITEANYPYNPKGCWDWFGWTGLDYASQSGTEASWLISYIKNISNSPQDYILKTKPKINKALQVIQK